MNLHTEDIVFSDPSIIDFLFSYRKGWLLYSPVFLLIIPGLYFLYRDQRKLFWPIVGFLAVYIYTMSSWECWWFASSFGSRAMVETYPLIVILIAIVIKSLSGLTSKLLVGSFFTRYNGAQCYSKRSVKVVLPEHIPYVQTALLVHIRKTKH